MPEVSQHAFAEKVALVTGGETAIGRAVAMQLAMYGAFVMVAHPRGDDSAAIVEELQSLGTLAAAVPFSKYGQTGASEIVKQVDDRYQRLDLLINCTGMKDSSDFEETTSERFAESAEILLESTFFNTKECVRLMEKRPSPRIVNIFSGGDPGDSISDLASETLNESIGVFTKVLAGYLPPKFQVNAVRVSNLSRPIDDSEKLDEDLFRSNAGVDPDIVARTVLFLLSSEARGLRGEILNLRN